MSQNGFIWNNELDDLYNFKFNNYKDFNFLQQKPISSISPVIIYNSDSKKVY